MEKNESMGHALEFAKIQAGLRSMSAEEMTNLVSSVAAGLMAASNEVGEASVACGGGVEFVMDPKKAIKEASITCVVCGKAQKVLTKNHLAKHDLTPKQYRAMCGYAKDQPLASKTLARARRKRMTEMRLWERRGKTTPDAKTE